MIPGGEMLDVVNVFWGHCVRGHLDRPSSRCRRGESLCCNLLIIGKFYTNARSLEFPGLFYVMKIFVLKEVGTNHGSTTPLSSPHLLKKYDVETPSSRRRSPRMAPL